MKMRASWMSMMGIVSLVTACGVAASAVAQVAAPAKPAPQPVVKPAPVAQPPAKPVGDAPVVKGGPYTPTITTQDGRANFESTDVDFGNISDDVVKEAEFKFTNAGTGPLEITNTQGSCGCTVGTLDKRVYAPGETGSIKVTFNPAHKRDQQHTTVTVTTNDGTRPQTVLNIKSFVKPLVSVEPQFALLNQIAKGQTGSTKVTITSRIPDLKILSVTPNVAYVDAVVGEMKEIEVNGEKVNQWELTITTNPNAPVGPVNAGMSIRTSDEKRVLTVNTTGEVVGDVMVTPARVQLANLSPGAPISAQFTLSARNGKAFKVLKTDDAPVSARAFSKIEFREDTSTTPPSYIITMTGQTSDQGGQVAGQILVATDVPGEEQVKVPYFGFARAVPKAAPAAPKANSVWDENPSTLVPPGPR